MSCSMLWMSELLSLDASGVFVTSWRFTAKTDQVVPKAVPKNGPNTNYSGFCYVLFAEMVPPERLELPTHWLQISCSTSWAIGALPLDNQKETTCYLHSYPYHNRLLHSGSIFLEHDTKLYVWHNVWHQFSTCLSNDCCVSYLVSCYFLTTYYSLPSQ